MQAPLFWHEMVSVYSQESLAEMSEKQPVMLIFLRFFGCSFCRESISDIAKQRSKIEAAGLRIVFVHMAADAATAEKFFKKYRLFPADHIPDPDKRFYQAFGLQRASARQLLGLTNWVRGFQAAAIEGHGAAMASAELGDGFQMPGLFVLYRGDILRSFIHTQVYDRPDYEAIARV